MKITQNRLREIVIEEVRKIENEDILKELYRQKCTEYGIDEILLEDKFGLVTGGLVAGLGLALVNMQMTNNAELEAKWAAAAAEAEAELSSLENKIDEMEGQQKNMFAWTWTDDDNPNSREMFPTIKFGNDLYTVLPPEYAVFDQVIEDKKNGVFRYGIPDSVKDIEQLQNAITRADKESSASAEQARLNFTKQFDHPALYDTASELTDGAVNSIGGQAYVDDDGNIRQMQAIVPDFKALESYYTDALPLTGVTVEQLYNNYMFGGYFSSEEGQMVADQLELEIEFDKIAQSAQQNEQKNT